MRQRRQQRRLARELASEYLDDNPNASAEEVRDAVSQQMDREYGISVDPASIMVWINFIIKLLSTIRGD